MYDMKLLSTYSIASGNVGEKEDANNEIIRVDSIDAALEQHNGVLDSSIVVEQGQYSWLLIGGELVTERVTTPSTGT